VLVFLAAEQLAMTHYISLIIAFPKTAIALIAAITFALLAALGSLVVTIDDEKMLPNDSPYVVATKKADSLFGQRYTVIVSVTAREGTVFQPTILEKVSVLTERLSSHSQAIPGKTLSLSSGKVKSISGDGDTLDVTRIYDPAIGALDMGELQHKIAEMEIYDGILVSEDQRTTAVIGAFKASTTGYLPLVKDITSIADGIRDEAVEVHVGGLPIFLGTIEQYTQRLGILIPLGILLIGLLHWEAFRTVQGFFLPLVTAVLAVVWSLGLMGIFGVQLDPFNSNAPIVILAVAAGHAVQILKRYYECYASEASKDEHQDPRLINAAAIAACMKSTGPVMICAGSVAAASLLSLNLFSVESIRSFGSITAVGIMSAVIMELTLIPAVRTLLPPPTMKAQTKPRHWDVVARVAARLCTVDRKWLGIATLVIAGVLLLGVTRVYVDNSLKAYFTADQNIRIDDAAINHRMAGANALFVIIEGNQPDAMKDPAVLSAMGRVQRTLSSMDGVGATLSINDFLWRLDCAIRLDCVQRYEAPASQDLASQYLFLYDISGGPGDFDSYVDNDYRAALMTVFLKSDGSVFLRKIEDAIDQELRGLLPPGVSYSIGGPITNPVALNAVIVDGKIKNIAMIAFVLFAFTTLLFRSILGGVLIVVPLVATTLVVFGLMGWAGTPLQISTATIAAMAIGIGADYAIYFTYRLREELAAGGAVEDAILRTFFSAGQAVMYVASAVMVGYGVLMLSPGFMIHFWLGSMMALTMFISALAALTVFPALLLALRPKFVFGALR